MDQVTRKEPSSPRTHLASQVVRFRPAGVSATPPALHAVAGLLGRSGDEIQGAIQLSSFC